MVLKRAAVAGPSVVAVPVPDNDSYLSDVGEFTGTCPRFLTNVFVSSLAVYLPKISRRALLATIKFFIVETSEV